MPNALVNETSPYLLQHKDNPVDWRPWGDEAIAAARDADKPIFLSIGYSACHWCHVMEHESFENADIAALLNERFVSIKVDREERPDLDQVYMNAVQAMTGRGGWPMSVFLTPDLKPFYGGTYWPATAGRGMPGFDDVLDAVHDAWVHRRDQAIATAEQLTDRLEAITQADGAGGELDRGLLASACAKLQQAFDPQHGGFGAAPKFPHTMDLQLLLRHAKNERVDALLEPVRVSLAKMAAGGLHDHLGGGFARYSVDERWLVPHFEKMLYDNALLAGLYSDAFAATGEPGFAQVARQTLDYVLRDMTDPAGGFYSSEDADSPPPDDPAGRAEEGLFYTWKPEEIRKVLGEEKADTFCRVYGVTPIGNFEGRNVLSLERSIAQHAEGLKRPADELAKELRAQREKLFAAREKRPRPGRDDKVITAWNGLMIEALARAAGQLGEPRYAEAAAAAADFLLEHLRDAEGRLLRVWRAGRAKQPAFLDDHAALACGLIALHEATLDPRRLDQAAELVDQAIERFGDSESGGFFYTPAGQEGLILRQKDLTDNATPGGNSLMATALVRLGKMTGEARWLDAAGATLEASSALLRESPAAMGQMLAALDLWLGPVDELVLAGPGVETIATELRRRCLPRAVLVGVSGQAASERLAPVLADKPAIDGKPTLYVCRDHACQAPIVGAEAIAAAIKEL